MSNTAAVQTQAASTLTVKAREIDRIASNAMALFEGAGSFEAELGVAQSIADLRAALSPEIMRPVMALMNTELGFLTDQDPNKPSKNNANPQPYSVEVVRDCVIEAKLRGFHVIGNEFNIISRRFYAAKNGLKRRCETWPGVTDLKIVVGLPRITGDQATVSIYGEWKKDGVLDKLTAPGGKPLEVLIRVNAFMGADAVVGKAERKLYKRIFDRLSGKVTPDGEISDDELTNAKPANATADKPAAPTPPPGATTPADAPQESASITPLQQDKPAELSEEEKDRQSREAGRKLGEAMEKEGVNFEDFRSYALFAKWAGPWDKADSFESLGLLDRDGVDTWLITAKRIAGFIRKFKTEGKR